MKIFYESLLHLFSLSEQLKLCLNYRLLIVAFCVIPVDPNAAKAGVAATAVSGIGSVIKYLSD